MILEYVKKRWFTIALMLLTLFALVRKNVRFRANEPTGPSSTESYEKYTDARQPSNAATMLNMGAAGGMSTVRLPDVDEATAVAFLKRFAQVAVVEQQKFGMPASVLLASAYVNSFAGKRDCAVEANNYLAAHCSGDWAGPTAQLSGGTCFRKYETAWESIRDFGTTHSRKPWYAAVKNEAGKAWKPWVKALAGHNVSDVENYEVEVVRVIGEYRLFELDED